MTSTVFGRYSELVVSITTLFLIGAAVVSHTMGLTQDLTFIDAAAMMGLGALYGKQSAANGYAAAAAAAHKRLDLIGAPAADDEAPHAPAPSELP